jgi:hypothetical protein
MKPARISSPLTCIPPTNAPAPAAIIVPTKPTATTPIASSKERKDGIRAIHHNPNDTKPPTAPIKCVKCKPSANGLRGHLHHAIELRPILLRRSHSNNSAQALMRPHGGSNSADLRSVLAVERQREESLAAYDSRCNRVFGQYGNQLYIGTIHPCLFRPCLNSRHPSFLPISVPPALVSAASAFGCLACRSRGTHVVAVRPTLAAPSTFGPFD